MHLIYIPSEDHKTADKTAQDRTRIRFRSRRMPIWSYAVVLLIAACFFIRSLMLDASALSDGSVSGIEVREEVQTAADTAGRNTCGNLLVTVVVQKGDTLWHYADMFGSEDGDPRDYVETAKECNGLKSSMLYEGQVLRLPLSG